jgi:hypothetical protein
VRALPPGLHHQLAARPEQVQRLRSVPLDGLGLPGDALVPHRVSAAQQQWLTTARAHVLRLLHAVVPEGFYLKGPGQVAPCVRGTFKSGFLPAAECTPCGRGVLTPREGSTSAANCTGVWLVSFGVPLGRHGHVLHATQRKPPCCRHPHCCCHWHCCTPI